MSATNETNDESVHVIPGGAPRNRSRISLDTWAVIFALVAGALIRAGVIKHIPW